MKLVPTGYSVTPSVSQDLMKLLRSGEVDEAVVQPSHTTTIDNTSIWMYMIKAFEGDGVFLAMWTYNVLLKTLHIMEMTCERCRKIVLVAFYFQISRSFERKISSNAWKMMCVAETPWRPCTRDDASWIWVGPFRSLVQAKQDKADHAAHQKDKDWYGRSGASSNSVRFKLCSSDLSSKCLREYMEYAISQVCVEGTKGFVNLYKQAFCDQCNPCQNAVWNTFGMLRWTPLHWAAQAPASIWNLVTKLKSKEECPAFVDELKQSLKVLLFHLSSIKVLKDNMFDPCCLTCCSRGKTVLVTTVLQQGRPWALGWEASGSSSQLGPRVHTNVLFWKHLLQKGLYI